MTEKLKKYRPEIAAMILWLAGAVTVSVFHEPWFDEIQAWQIARTATWHDLFFEVPHSECHPILWHLILRPFAMAGLPFEPAIKTVNIAVTGTACGLILFGTRLPRFVRLLLPFTFMIFYQTAVVNRCYCLLFLGFTVLGILRPERDSKPLPYVITMAFMCLTHIMGVMMCGLICVIWVTEIVRGHAADKNSGNILKDRRVPPLAVLFVLAVAVIIAVFPSTENTNFDSDTALPSFGRVIALSGNFISLPFDATFCPTLRTAGTGLYLLFFVLINAFMVVFCRKKRCTAEYFVPYLVFSYFYAFVWSWEHMMQVYYYFLVYIFIAFAGENYETAKELLGKLHDERLKKGFTAVAAVLFLLMPASAAASSASEIKRTYFDARPVAEFIKDNGLEDLRIFSMWKVGTSQSHGRHDTDQQPDEPDPYKDIDVRCNPYATTLGPYFDHQVISNNYDPGHDRWYITHKRTSEEDVKNCYEQLSEQPYPDMIIGNMSVLDTIFGEDEVKKHRFKMVYRCTDYFPWKFSSMSKSSVTVWLRDDLLDRYNLHEVPPDYNEIT